jgi:hypothetical protein
MANETMLDRGILTARPSAIVSSTVLEPIIPKPADAVRTARGETAESMRRAPHESDGISGLVHETRTAR